MKIINVDNIILQFDSIDGEDISPEYVNSMIKVINQKISEYLPTSEPTLTREKKSKITIISLS